jgi:Fic family protein
VTIVNYIKVSQAADKWGISARRVRVLCAENKIAGVIRRGKLYMIPEDAPRPIDNRQFNGKSLPEQFASMFRAIDTKKNELLRSRPLTPGEVERLREEFIINFTYNSNAIEGNTLTMKETAMVLEGITIDQKPLKDHLEAVGHRDAFLYVQNLVGKEINLTESIIKNIHSLVLMNRPEDKGVFRRIPVTIVGAYKEPVQPYLIEPLMNELIQNNTNKKSTMHSIERIARFHLEFEGIHPFIDGNGRAGRLILNLDLMQNGYPPINIKFADRKKYYEAFDTYFAKNDASAMIELVANYVVERLNEYLRILN